MKKALRISTRGQKARWTGESEETAENAGTGRVGESWKRKRSTYGHAGMGEGEESTRRRGDMQLVGMKTRKRRKRKQEQESIRQEKTHDNLTPRALHRVFQSSSPRYTSNKRGFSCAIANRRRCGIRGAELWGCAARGRVRRRRISSL
jgi:hypothetical protein